VDGQTYLPLQVAVFAKGGAEPVFLAGFTSISYDPIDDSIFEVPSPAGAQIEQKQLQWPSDRPNAEANTAPIGAGEGTKSTHAGHEPLTIEEASAEAGFTVLAAQTSDPAYAFQGAYVLDLPKGALDIATDMGSGAVSGLAGIVDGPVVVLVYGQGFGTVLMVQAETASIPPEALQSLQTGFPFLQTTDVNGTTALRFGTPLMSLLAWQQEASTVIVAGSLSAADLTAFAASVR
jgi:hypothetical protein